MAYDEGLAERIRSVLKRRRNVTERKMFGGMAFMISGNMCCGVVRRDLMLRLGPEGAEAALEEEYTRPMDFTGKPMRGMVYVDPSGTEASGKLAEWIQRGLDFLETLPPK